MSSPTFGEVLELTHPTAESAVLAGLLAGDDHAAEIIQALEPTDFHNERYGVVFEAMRTLLGGVEPIDRQAVVAECRRVIGHRGLKLSVNESHLTFEGDPKRAVPYAQTVKRLSWLRNAAGFAHWMIQELQAKPDPEALFAEAQEKWGLLRPLQKDSSFVYGWDTIESYTKTLAERAKPDNNTVRWEWPWLSWRNKVRYLRPGMVGQVAAPDGMGKSTYLEMIAEHLAMIGLRTVLVHLEDDLEYKLDRRMARYAQVPMENIEDAKLTRAEQAAIKEATGNIGIWAERLHYYHAPGKSMVEIVRELESRVSEGECQAVILDYLNKVEPTRAQVKMYGDNQWNRQGNDMSGLKNFAERSNLAVMTATQGNKAMQNGGMQTRQNIEGSGKMSQQSQLVIILTRELVGEGGQFDKNKKKIAEMGDYSPIVNVRVDKQNRGKECNFQQVLAGRFFTVKDMTLAEEPQS